MAGEPEEIELEIRAYHAVQGPAAVSNAVGLQPTSTVRAGQPSVIPELGTVPRNGWFYVVPYTSLGETREAVTRLLGQLEERSVALDALVAGSWEVSVIVRVPLDDGLRSVLDRFSAFCRRHGLEFVSSPS